MDKDKLIGALEKLKSEAMGAYYHEGVSDSISLIEQWQDEPITAEALRADGWQQSEGLNGAFCKTKDGRHIITVNLAIAPPIVRLFISDGKMVEFHATTMTHLRALGDIFLS